MYNSFNDLNVPMLCINKRGNKLLLARLEAAYSLTWKCPLLDLGTGPCTWLF